ncbi:MAG: peptidylprolyl isomerase [Rhodospirillales bacterium]|nr:peptidylprolyl isomerase [Rhodospirillales bacterium]
MPLLLLVPALLVPALLVLAAAPPARAQAHPPAGAAAVQDASHIVAIVNGQVITAGDVANRRRLFALSTGQPVTQDVLARLTPQIIRQLIDEKLRLQEIERRHVVVTAREIAQAIGEVEQRNGMAQGALRQRLAADGVSLQTLIDQMRVQIGWGQVLRQALGSQADVTPADIKLQQDQLKSEIGQPEFEVGEIFIPIGAPSQTADATRFADTVIQQLRTGAPFPVVAAQFSQSQTALQGGDLGWVQAAQLDPAVLRVVQEMPPGAISNPIPVAGGLSIVTLRAKRVIGRDPAMVVQARQVFLRFPTPLDPANPTPAQRALIDRARALGPTLKSCDAVSAAAKEAGTPNGGDLGTIRLDTVAVPALRQMMSTLAVGTASQPLIANDGVAVMMVCSRGQQDLGIPDQKELATRILNDRVELASRRLIRDLERRAMIERRS